MPGQLWRGRQRDARRVLFLSVQREGDAFVLTMLGSIFALATSTAQDHFGIKMGREGPIKTVGYKTFAYTCARESKKVIDIEGVSEVEQIFTKSLLFPCKK